MFPTKFNGVRSILVRAAFFAAFFREAFSLFCKENYWCPVIAMMGPYDTRHLNATFEKARFNIRTFSCYHPAEVAKDLAERMHRSITTDAPILVKHGGSTKVLDDYSYVYDEMQDYCYKFELPIYLDRALYFRVSLSRVKDPNIYMQVIIEMPMTLDVQRIFEVEIGPEDTPASIMQKIEKVTYHQIFFGHKVALSVRHIDWKRCCRARHLDYPNPYCNHEKIYKDLTTSFLRASESFMLVSGATAVLTDHREVLWTDKPM